MPAPISGSVYDASWEIPMAGSVFKASLLAVAVFAAGPARANEPSYGPNTFDRTLDARWSRMRISPIAAAGRGCRQVSPR